MQGTHTKCLSHSWAETFYLPRLIHPLLQGYWKTQNAGPSQASPSTSSAWTSRTHIAMLLPLRTRSKTSCHRRIRERLLPAIELHEYSIDAITNASRHPYNGYESDISTQKIKFQICPQGAPTFERLQRIATSLKFEKARNCVEALIRRSPRQSRNQWVILQDTEELACCDKITTESETSFRKQHQTDHLQRAERRSGSDAGFRSTVNWYFWSPEAAKNCPPLEFLRIHLAPTNVWL